ncbi:MAG: tyrosine-type recombinase/integrase [Dehalococcoidales bacterium]|nr:tyrosine-type recombinase/integrase [Dehalococcoidales bacterium]
MTNVQLAPAVDVAFQLCHDIGIQGQDIVSRHACLSAEYTAYMTAAGYSTGHCMVNERIRAARSFLQRFPDPNEWLNLPVEQQLRCRSAERTFVHYLFLRHLLPMPPQYILCGRHNLGDMAIRLMERETYQRYQAMGKRLGYSESDIRRQFLCLVYLMAWAQKPVDALTPNDMATFADSLKNALARLGDKSKTLHLRDGLPAQWSRQLVEMPKVLFHLGILPSRLSRRPRRKSFDERWAGVPEQVRASLQRYLGQLALVFQPSSLTMEDIRLRRFFSWLAGAMPEVTRVNEIRRCHIEAFKEHLRWVSPHPRYYRPPGITLKSDTVAHTLRSLGNFFSRITEWAWQEAPTTTLIFDGDIPRIDAPRPRFLDESDAARFLRAAQGHPDLFTRVCGVTLLRTGLRKSEFLGLTADCIVQIGSSYWLRVPLVKFRRERYVPLHPEVKQLLDEWFSHQPQLGPADFLFTRHGDRMRGSCVDFAVQRIAMEAGVPGKVTPHRLRHTLATLAINRGMSLESIANLLGHRSLSMTLVYARISNRTLHREYSAVSQQLEHLCGQSSPFERKDVPSLPATAEGPGMRKLRQEAHWRLLGNGYCMRPEGVPCEYETICESCSCFLTTSDFLPTLYKQKRDAEDKGHARRTHVLNQLIQRVENSR